MSWQTFCPSDVFKSIQTLFLPRFKAINNLLSPFGELGEECLHGSPTGGSIFITVAPKSVRS